MKTETIKLYSGRKDITLTSYLHEASGELFCTMVANIGINTLLHHLRALKIPLEVGLL
jgi:hypothetical protein